MHGAQQQPRPRLADKRDSNTIEWKDYPLIAPGQYRAYCAWGKHYRELIERRKIARQVDKAGSVMLSANIFHLDGEPVGDFRKAWQTACVKAGLANSVVPPAKYLSMDTSVRSANMLHSIQGDCSTIFVGQPSAT